MRKGCQILLRLLEDFIRAALQRRKENDNHNPYLTVGQTLDFALSVKTPGKRPAGVSRADFKERVIALLLKMFNIEHTKNTIVGNAFTRGVSGGERKVFIAQNLSVDRLQTMWRRPI